MNFVHGLDGIGACGGIGGLSGFRVMIGRLFEFLANRLAMPAVFLMSAIPACAAETKSLDQKIDELFGWATGWFVNGIFADLPINGYPVKLV